MTSSRRGMLFGAGIAGFASMFRANTAQAGIGRHRLFHHAPPTCQAPAQAPPVAVSCCCDSSQPTEGAGIAPHAFVAGTDIAIVSAAHPIVRDGTFRDFTLFGLFHDPDFKDRPRYRVIVKDESIPGVVWNTPDNFVKIVDGARLTFKAMVEPPDAGYGHCRHSLLSIRVIITNSIRVGYKELGYHGPRHVRVTYAPM